MTLRRWTPLLMVLLAACGSNCQKNQGGEDAGVGSSSANAKVQLPGIDVSELTAREHATWSGYVSELLAPCPEVAVSIAQCVQEKRPCDTCTPAAEFLLRQVQAGHPKKVVADVFAARFDPKKVKTIVVGESAAKGADDPYVTIVEFADFECPACGAAFPIIEQLYAKYGKEIRLVFKHFPLAAHPNAKLAARAAYAAQKQGQFWKMHKVLFTNQERLTEPDLMVYAEQVGLNIDRFRKDMHSDAAKDWVNKEKQQGETLGVDATPTLFINGRDCDLSKLGSLDDFEDWVALEIKLAKKNRGEEGSTKPAKSASASATAAGSAAPAPSGAASAAPTAAPGKAP